MLIKASDYLKRRVYLNGGLLITVIPLADEDKELIELLLSNETLDVEEVNLNDKYYEVIDV